MSPDESVTYVCGPYQLVVRADAGDSVPFPVVVVAARHHNTLGIDMDILRAMAVLIEYPFLALAPAVVFTVLFTISKSRLVLITGLLWLVYFPYEYGMKLRILCSGECNIRIDLLVLYPALILVSLAGLVMFAIAVWKND